MKIHVGDKILMKKVEDLSEYIKQSGEENLKNFGDLFAGKEFTVSTILRKNPLSIEIEEDEDMDTDKYLFANMAVSALLDFEKPMTKKHHFSEEFIEKVISDSENEQNDEPTLHSFGWALRQLKKGLKVARKGWNGKGLWLELQRPDAHSKMTLPYIYMNYPKGDKYHDGCRVPWLASQTDMLEEDWYEVD